jgi:hypothetical protein
MHDRKTVGQVSLRFPIQEGAIVIARTSKRERLEKHDDFYFKRDPAEMDEMASFKIGASTIKDIFLPHLFSKTSATFAGATIGTPELGSNAMIRLSFTGLRILPMRSTIPKTAMRLQTRCAVSSGASSSTLAQAPPA